MSAPWIVLKVGSSCLAEPAAWQILSRQVRACRAEGHQVLVVLSGLPGVEADVQALLAAAVSARHEAGLDALCDRLRAFVKGLWASRPMDEPAERRADTLAEAEVALEEDLAELRRHALGVAVLAGIRPAVLARVRALARTIAARVFRLWLVADGLPAEGFDPRPILRALDGPDRRHYLAAQLVIGGPEPLTLGDGPILIAPGGIAAGNAGETVLVGAGGSDLTAAVLAIRAAALRLDIWRLEEGLATADGRVVRSARPVLALDFEEAMELSASGAGLVHPRALDAAALRGLEIHLHSLGAPEAPATVISSSPADDELPVRAIHAQKGLTVLSIEAAGGGGVETLFGPVFAALGEHGFAPGLVASSRSSLSLALTTPGDAAGLDALTDLVGELGRAGRVRRIQPCTAVVVVGRGLRAVIHQLGPALEALGTPRLRLLVQSTEARNLTLVVDDAAAEGLVRALHARLFPGS